MSNKVIKDGKVAVLYSPGFGAGWSTWNMYPEGRDSPLSELLFDSVIVDFVLNKPENWLQGIEAYCELIYPGAYTGGASDLEVMWIPAGSQFLVEEYDGSESVVLSDEMKWIVA
jgi:hypothetical protein